MAKQIRHMSTIEIKEEMSIAGNPDKIIKMMYDILVITGQVDSKNVMELVNLEFALKRIQAEVRQRIRVYEKKTGQKII